MQDVVISVNSDLTLVSLNAEDAKTMFQLVDHNRDFLGKWLPWVKHTKTVEDSEKYISYVRKKYEEKKVMDLGIFYQNTFVGCIGLHEIDSINKKTSIGYWLGESYQGRGIMHESVKALIRHSFHTLGMNRIEIRSAVGNTRSRKVIERLGLKFEGILREAEWVNDHFVDHEVFSILKSEIENSEAANS